MSVNITPARGGDFATSRRGGLDHTEVDFIRQKADQGVRSFNIARMLGRSVQDVELWLDAHNPPAREAPRLGIPKPKVRQVLSLWRGLITIPEPAEAPAGRLESKREIAERIIAEYDVTLDEVRGPRRLRSIVRARQHIMHEMVVSKRWSLSQVGQYLGGRDHTTVLEGYRRHAQRMAELEKLAAQ